MDAVELPEFGRFSEREDEEERLELAAAASGSGVPKMRSLAAWYSASRAAKLLAWSESWMEDAEELDGREDVAEGRFRMRNDGRKASGGGAATELPPCEEMTSSGIGALLFLCDVPR